MTILKTAKLSSKRQITIPKCFKTLSSGDNVVLEIKKNYLKISPKVISKESFLNEKALKKDWNSKEDEINYAHLQNLI